MFERQIYHLIKAIDEFVHNLGLDDSESAEAPLFVDSRMSRIIQLADLAARAVWRRYEQGDTGYFDRIVSRFDSEGGVIHGLVHYKPRDERCHCPACMSRFALRE